MSTDEGVPRPAARRSYEAIGEAESLGGQLKRATVRGREIVSDESVSFGGGASAPSAIDYFVAAVMF